jgi:uncharacterized protein YciI
MEEVMKIRAIGLHMDRIYQVASQNWFAVIGPKVKALGEIKTSQQIFQEQLAQTAAMLTGFTFSCEHRVAKAAPVVTK